MTYYDSWAALEAAIKNECNQIIETEIVPKAEEILRKHIASDIYGAYTPKPGAWVNGTTYSRRHVLEGSVYSRKEGEGRYLVTSDASASPSVVPGYSFSPRGAGSFLALLESGNMGIWRGGFARPAVGNAQKEVDQMIVSVLKSRLG
ncbi:MAG: hypothetical protein ACLR6W_00015 [Evtepia sp.]